MTNTNTNTTNTTTAALPFVHVDSGVHKGKGRYEGTIRAVAQAERSGFHRGAAAAGAVAGVAADEGMSAGKRFRLAAGLDWTYGKVPCTHPISGAVIPGKNWITTSANDQVAWGPVSDGYTVAQLADLDTMADVAMSRGAVVKSMLSMKHGERVVMFLRMPAGDAEGPRGHVLECNGLVANGQGTREALVARSHVFVPACENAVTSSLCSGDNLHSLAHNATLANRLSVMEAAITDAGTYSAAVAEFLKILDGIDVTKDEVANWAYKALDVDEAIANVLRYEGCGDSKKARLMTPRTIRMRANAVDLFMADYEEAPGAAPRTLFGVHQALTFRTTHRLARTDEGANIRSRFGGAAYKAQQVHQDSLVDWAMGAASATQARALRGLLSGN